MFRTTAGAALRVRLGQLRWGGWQLSDLERACASGAGDRHGDFLCPNVRTMPYFQVIVKLYSEYLLNYIL